MQRRKAAARYALRLLLVAVIPAALPALPWNKLPEPLPEPKVPQSMEQPAYDNEPAEPAEGTATR